MLLIKILSGCGAKDSCKILCSPLPLIVISISEYLFSILIFLFNNEQEFMNNIVKKISE